MAKKQPKIFMIDQLSYYVKIILGITAVWRLSSMLINDSGPLRIIEHMYSIIDDLSYVSFSKSKIVSYVFASIRDGFHCYRCNSVWFGLLYSLLISENALQLVLYALLFSSTTILINDTGAYLWERLNNG